MKVGLIWAQGQNRELGYRGVLPWNLPEDLRFFSCITHGHPVIMGRNTWKSLPADKRPLPGRINIVLSRTNGFCAPGAHVAQTLDNALKFAHASMQTTSGADETHYNSDVVRSVAWLPQQNPADVWIIGGASLYQEALSSKIADVLLLTDIEASFPCADTFAPALDLQYWQLRKQSPHMQSDQGFCYSWKLYTCLTTCR